VNENAFAFIVQARPCPTFGRPVHLRSGPHRLRPGTSPHALRIPPHDGHPALRRRIDGGFRSALAVSGFRFRARLDFSIPSISSGPRGVTPAFGYGAPHPSARGTSTLLSNALLSAHCSAVRLLEDVRVGRTALAFSHRPVVWFTSGISEVSRFSCMEFPDVHGVSDYAGPTWNSH
jgi:hypothetical protein